MVCSGIESICLQELCICSALPASAWYDSIELKTWSTQGTSLLITFLGHFPLNGKTGDRYHVLIHENKKKRDHTPRRCDAYELFCSSFQISTPMYRRCGNDNVCPSVGYACLIERPICEGDAGIGDGLREDSAHALVGVDAAYFGNGRSPVRMLQQGTREYTCATAESVALMWI